MLFRLLISVLFLAAAEQPAPGPIRFADVTRSAGIAFTHSFGAQQLGQRQPAQKGAADGQEVASGHAVAESAAAVRFAENRQHDRYLSWWDA